MLSYLSLSILSTVDPDCQYRSTLEKAFSTGSKTAGRRKSHETQVENAEDLQLGFCHVNFLKYFYFKRFFMIDHFVHFSECLIKPPSHLCNSNNTFLNSKISTNHKKRVWFWPIVKSLYSLMFHNVEYLFVFSMQRFS